MDPLPTGKVDARFFDAVIYPHLGARDPSVLVPPQHGVDFGVVDLGGGQVMALSTDPLVIQPALGFERAAWLAFQIVVADAAVSGLTPRWLACSWNLPPDLRDEEVATLLRTFDGEARKWGLSLVTGHTARYEECRFPIVGAATAMATGPRERLVTPRGIQPGDRVIVTKSPGLEAALVLAVEFPEVAGTALRDRLLQQFPKLSPLPEAFAAAAAGGVTAMHDATECGLLGALHEMAAASGVGLRVDLDPVPVNEEVAAACRAFGLDPYAVNSEGTLVITAPPQVSAPLLDTLAQKGIAAVDAGEALPRGASSVLVRGGKNGPLQHPRVDGMAEAWRRLGASRPSKG